MVNKTTCGLKKQRKWPNLKRHLRYMKPL